MIYYFPGSYTFIVGIENNSIIVNFFAERITLERSLQYIL